MNNVLVKISVGFIALVLCASCSQLNKLSFKPKKPFEERSFDAKLWRDGDRQTRGEMITDLRWGKTGSNGYLNGKSRQEILVMLGEPDRKTRGMCCGAGGTYEEEVWLYDIDFKNADSSITQKHFQIYFTESGKTDAWRVEKWDDKNPDYYPRVG